MLFDYRGNAGSADFGFQLFSSGGGKIQLVCGCAIGVAFVGFEDGVASVPASGPALIYSDVTGELSWDPTGGSAADQVLIATLTTSPELFKADILLV
jgi:hypothetical protein